MPQTRPYRQAKNKIPSTRERAYDASLNAFVNAFVKETDLARYEEAQEGPAFVLDLVDGELLVPCAHRSQTGRHGFRGPCYRRDGSVEAITFTEAVGSAARTLAESEEDARILVRRVLRSRRNLDDAVEDRRGDLDHLFQDALGFLEAEQALLAGHSLHPCPKDRGGVGPRQARAWAACHAPSFPLVWLAADRDRVQTWASASVQPAALLAELAADDAPGEGPQANGEELWIPCHPHQLHRWRARPGLAAGFEDGSFRILGEGARSWRATSSVRTLYARDAAWMLKVSLSLKLTNSLRHLHLDELARGPRFTDLLASEEGSSFLSGFPHLTILEEPLSLALCDEAGRPVEATGMTLRANPFTRRSSQNTEVLATLLQDDPRDGEPRLAKRLRAQDIEGREAMERWFDRFLAVAVRPFLLAHADHGIIFGAHQQNLVLGLEGGWPQTVFFRDCQGVGFSPLGRDRYADRLEGWGEDVALTFESSTANTLLAYYLVVNSVFNVVSSLATTGWVPETALVEQLAGFLQQLEAEDPRDASLLRSLLRKPELSLKGNLHYAVHGIDETTQSCDVLELYRPIPNPIAEVQA